MKSLARLAALSLFGTMACSKSDPATPDAATPTIDAAADVTVEAGGGSCDLDAPFGTATLVDYHDAADGGAIPLSGFFRLDAKEERFAIFDAEQGPSTKIFLATRNGASFVAGKERVASASVAHAYPALSPDGKLIYFSAIVNGKNAIHRAESDAADLTSAEVWLSDAQENLTLPYVPSAEALYFIRGGAAMRVHVDLKSGKAGTPVAVDGVPANVNAIAVNAAETVLYYGEGSSFATASIHEMRKSGSTWTAKDAQPIALVGLQKVESPTWLSADGCRLYVRGWPSVVDRALYVVAKPKN